MVRTDVLAVSASVLFGSVMIVDHLRMRHVGEATWRKWMPLLGLVVPGLWILGVVAGDDMWIRLGSGWLVGCIVLFVGLAQFERIRSMQTDVSLEDGPDLPQGLDDGQS